MRWCWENVLPGGVGEQQVSASLHFVFQLLQDTLFQSEFVFGKQWKYFPFIVQD